MKWPIYEQKIVDGIRSTKTIYLTKILDWKLDENNCKACKQCSKACPKDALEMPTIPRGIKVPFKDRMPIMPDPAKCVFCGICMSVCPYDAISMQVEGVPLTYNQLKLVKGGMLPMQLDQVKVGKLIPSVESFENPFWNALLERIILKKKSTS